MTRTGARAAGTADGRNGAGQRERDGGKTPAQWYCYIFGATLLIAGLLGFIVDQDFDTATTDDSPRGFVNGDLLLGLEVNGWHNVVHIASGLVLLLLATKRSSARLGAITFGVVYAAVTIIGFIDGEDIFGVLPVNTADNLLHLAIAALGIIAGLLSKGRDDDRDERVARDAPSTAAVDTPRRRAPARR